VAKVAAVLTAGIVALLAPGLARAYGWPVKPFDQQHAIRGAFDDPRSGLSFHFGVDIAAPDGTPVYSVAPGTVYRYPDAVAVREPGGHEFSYWHIDGIVAEHSDVQTGDLLGYVKAGWGHVHLAEFDGTSYINPLRPGGLEPFVDHTTPVIASIDVDSGDGLTATVDTYDPPPIAPPPPWQDARWTPETIRWRITRNDREVIPWLTVVDFTTLLPPAMFDQIYAPGTEQNRAEHPGRYVFWLFRGLALQPGQYELEVEAQDSAGNTALGSTAFTVSGARPRMHIR
jgi:hypothetical protein